MQTIIVDSSSLVALANEKDSTHDIALKTVNSFEEPVRVIVPVEILAETLNTIGKKIGKIYALNTGKELFTSEIFEILESNSIIRLTAFEKFAKQKASVSFTDCLVMAFADEFETQEIFGFDESFAKNGYLRVGIDK